MLKGGRWRLLKQWAHHNREHDEYMLMLRVKDWKLDRKTDVFRSLVPDSYVFPPFQHITLFGPFTILPGKTPETVYRAIESASEKIPGISFVLTGYLRLKGRRGQAITHGITPSVDLSLFHERLWYLLSTTINSLSWIDHDPKTRRFHVTHAYNLRSDYADLICGTVKTCQAEAMGQVIDDENNNIRVQNFPLNMVKTVVLPDYSQITSYRVIVLKNGFIDREFDLPAHEWLNRQLVFNHNRTAVTLMQYRKLAGLELTSAPPVQEKPPYILSDLHLGHYNITRYCRRPFSNAGEMDRVLVDNWNRTVGEQDEVLYLGDFRYGSEAPPSAEYLPRLNGRITFIRGNHDYDIPGTIPSLVIRYSGTEYLFIHDPGDAPPGFTGWVVHGHYHNNDLKRFPFINFETRRVNVSCELTAYRPVSLQKIHTLISECSGQTVNIGTIPGIGPFEK